MGLCVIPRINNLDGIAVDRFFERRVRLEVFSMKARVSIRIPKMGGTATEPSSAAPGTGGAATSAASRRKKLLAYTAPKITDVLGQAGGAGLKGSGKISSSSSTASLIDHNNLPKAWQRGGHESQGERADAELRRRARKTHVRPLKGRAAGSMGASLSVPELSRSTFSETDASAADPPPSSPATSPTGSNAPTLSTTQNAPNTSTNAPSNSLLPAWQNQPAFLRLDQSKMPLEAFDNDEFESKSGTPEDWLACCRTGRVRY